MTEGSAKKVVPATVNFRSSCLYCWAICNSPAVIATSITSGLASASFSNAGRKSV